MRKYLVLAIMIVGLTGCSLNSSDQEIDSGSTIQQEINVVESGAIETGEAIFSKNNVFSDTGGTISLKTNEKGGIVFQQIFDYGKLPSVAGDGPQYIIMEHGNIILLVPDYFSGKVQSFDINSNTTLNFTTSNPLMEDSNIVGFDYGFIIESKNGDTFTVSPKFSGKVYLNGNFDIEKIFDIYKGEKYILISRPGFGYNDIIVGQNNVFEFDNEKVYQSLRKIEESEGDFLNCYTDLIWDKIKEDKLYIFTRRAKTQCSVVSETIGDEYEQAIYEREPTTDTYIFVKTEKID